MTLMMRPSRPGPTGTAIGRPVSVDFLAAHQTFGDVHRDGAHGRFAEMLRDFEHQAVAAVLGLERVQDRRQIAVELHVDDGADDLGDRPTCSLWPCLSPCNLVELQTTVSVTGMLPRVALE